MISNREPAPVDSRDIRRAVRRAREGTVAFLGQLARFARMETGVPHERDSEF